MRHAHYVLTRVNPVLVWPPVRDPTSEGGGANGAGAEAHPSPLVTRKGLTRSPWVGRGADGAAATVPLQGRRASIGLGVR